MIDVSPANDWSIVRVWWPPTGEMGITDYPAYGFIRADRPATHDQIDRRDTTGDPAGGERVTAAAEPNSVRGCQAASSRRSRTLT